MQLSEFCDDVCESRDEGCRGTLRANRGVRPRRIEKSAGGRIQPERLGRNSEISSISVIRISMTTMVAQIIKMSGKVSSTLIFNMRVVVNRHTAIGGVQPPIAKATHRIMPKWTTL